MEARLRAARAVGKLESTMKRFLLSTIGLIALDIAAPAFAADLPAQTYTKAPSYIAAIYDWSGLYFGGNAGYGSSRECWDLVTPGSNALTAEGCHDATGAVAGGQIGYRWQLGTWVFGVEGQGDWAGLTGSNVNGIAAGHTDKTKVDAFGLLTGQAGYAWNNALFYVKGGAAITADKYNEVLTTTGAAFANAQETRYGGVIGAGVEYGFSPNWSAGVNYDHMFMGKNNLGFTDPATGLLMNTQRVGQDVDLVTARINYKWGGPVIGKY
jgi:outer membrane immunogenic protein